MPDIINKPVLSFKIFIAGFLSLKIMMKFINALLLTTICVLSHAQYDNTDSESIDPRIEEVKQYMWSNADSNFLKTDIPEKWKEESAVIIARNTESSVRKKPLSSKLYENFYFHERIKLLDNNAVEKYTEFSFRENSKRFVGLFKTEKVDRYVGFKIEKPNGDVEEVDIAEAVDKSIEGKRSTFSYKKIAIPNLQVGDIIDYYYCTEYMFHTGKFYAFSPVYYQFQEDYPIVWQKLKVAVLNGCYLKARSVNGAPSLKSFTDPNDSEVISYELEDTDRNKLVHEEWSNLYKEIPVIKLQLFYTNSGILSAGYESFYKPLDKMTSEVNADALSEFTYQMIFKITGSYSPYRSMYNSAIKFLKKKSKSNNYSQTELAKEAYYFLREFWYQQQFYASPQILGYYRDNFDSYLLNYLMSAVLLKLNIDFEALYVIPNSFTNPEDLLFFGEFYPAIRLTKSDSTIIAAAGATKNYFDMPNYYTGATAFVVPVNNKNFNNFSKTVLPEYNLTDHKEMVVSEVSFNNSYDSIKVKSRFELSGCEKIGWDSVMFVSDVIRNEFKALVYGQFIKDKCVVSTIKVSKEKELAEFREKEAKDRKEKILAKLKDSYGITEVNLNDFNVISYGRWDNEPNLIFELDYTIPANAQKLGGSIIFNTGSLTSFHSEKLDEKREYDIYLPNRRLREQRIIFKGLNSNGIAGLEEFNKAYQSKNLAFKSNYQISGDSIIVDATESVFNNSLKKEDWTEVLDFNQIIDQYSHVKIKISTIKE